MESSNKPRKTVQQQDVFPIWTVIATCWQRRWRWLIPPALCFVAGIIASFIVVPSEVQSSEHFTFPAAWQPLTFQSVAPDISLNSAESNVYTASFISLNNLKVAVYTFLGSAFFALPGLWTCFENGRLGLGFPLLTAFQKNLQNQALLFIVPHALFECMALWLASAGGLLLGIGTLKRAGTSRELVIDSSIFAIGSIFLFTIAALIETLQLSKP